MRAGPPAAPVGLLAHPQGDAPHLHARALSLELVERLRAAIPDLALGTDIIVGFPGETEADFRETLEVVEEVGFDSAFTFVYSPRAGTDAAAMPDQVPHETKIERMERLVELTQRVARGAERRARRGRGGGARRGTVAHRRLAGPRPDASKHDGQLHRRCGSGRARHGADRLGDLDDASGNAASTHPGLTPVVALFGPTASGKSAVARTLLDRLDATVVSADSAAVYRDLPVLTAAPDYPARLVGLFPLSHEVSVGEYQRLAHAAIDEALDAERTPVVAGGTGLYLRAALSALEFPPPPEPGARERWTKVYDELGAEEAHTLLDARDPAAAARVHANDRRRVVRALELAEAGSSLAPPEDQLWAEDVRQPTLIVSLHLAEDELERRIQARTERMVERGAVEEAAWAWAQPLSETARKVLGLEQFATLPLADAIAAVVAATRRLARYQRKWIRRVPGVVTLAADRPPEELADEIVALAGARERLPRR